MPLVVKHSFLSQKPDAVDTTQVRPSDWNAEHIVMGTIEAVNLNLTDTTDNNVTTDRHGFIPKLDGNDTHFFNGVGEWATSSTTLPEVQLVSDPSSLDVDLSLGSIVYVTMNGGLSLTVHNIVSRQRYTFMVHQIAGGDAVGWDADIFKGAIAIGSGMNDGAGLTTIQEFIGMNGDRLVAVSPGIGNIAYNYPIPN